MTAEELFDGLYAREILYPFGGSSGPQAPIFYGVADVLTLLERLEMGDAGLMDATIAETSPEPRWIYRAFNTERVDGRLACGCYGFEGELGKALQAIATIAFAPQGAEAFFAEYMARMHGKVFAWLKARSVSSVEIRNPPPPPRTS